MKKGTSKKRGRPAKGPKMTNISDQRTDIVPVKKTPPVFTREAMTEKYLYDAFDMLGIAAKLNEREKRLFVEMARMNNLNPLKREIHAVAMWDADSGGSKLVPVTGYEVYIDRAEETGRLKCWNVTESGTVKEGDYQATVHIQRRDWPTEFAWTSRYSEVCRRKKDGVPTQIWKERPTFMTQKVAISQGFRLCFREVLKGMPYTMEEMVGDEMKNVTPLAEPKAKEAPEPVNVAPVEKDAEKAAPDPLEAAREALQAVYRQMGASGRFKDKLESYRNMAVKAKDDLESLTDLAAAWKQELGESI